MTISNQIQDYLRRNAVDFDVVSHPHAPSGMRIAEAAHIGGDCLAKGVLMEDDNGLMLAVVPATHRINIGALHRRLSHQVGLATEQEVSDAFTDCEPGAVPAIGAAYGLRTLVDDSLFGHADIYFEGGDHRALVHMKGKAFDQLLGDSRCGVISSHL